jgi:anti-sigma-K factor RsiG
VEESVPNIAGELLAYGYTSRRQEMTETHRRRIDIVMDPAFVAGLADADMDSLREKRSLCNDLDAELSYYRRLLHGRLDLLNFEIRRRAGEETRSLIEALPEILASDMPAASRTGTPRSLPIDAPDIPDTGRRTVDRVLGDDFLTKLPLLGDVELEEIRTSLADVERVVSKDRRAVFSAHETINDELARRYRDGLTSVDELLKST